jgi:hypothetical protein
MKIINALWNYTKFYFVFLKTISQTIFLSNPKLFKNEYKKKVREKSVLKKWLKNNEIIVYNDDVNTSTM